MEIRLNQITVHKFSLYAHIHNQITVHNFSLYAHIHTYTYIEVEKMFFRLKNPLFSFCLFANSASYLNLPDFTSFYWILVDSTIFFDSVVNFSHFTSLFVALLNVILYSVNCNLLLQENRISTEIARYAIIYGGGPWLSGA